MKVHFAVWAALVSLALAISSVAQGTRDSVTDTGTVISTGNVSIAIQTDQGEAKSFIVDTQTSMPPEGLTVGARVSVQYKRLGESRFQAIAVTVLELPPAEPSGSTPGEPPRRSVSPTLLIALAALAVEQG